MPTQTITDRDFTGQKENRELGLLYYQARFYVPGIGRFASADTLVPDPANPQSYNRYSYVENRPLNFLDPTGHCKGNYDLNTGIATEEQDCWDFLHNEFCAGGSVAICSDWHDRLFPSVFFGCWGSVPCLMSFEQNYWTRDELVTLRDSIASVIGALTNGGYDGYGVLEGIRFTRVHGWGFSMAFPSSHVYLSQVDQQTIWHEVGHNISFRNGRVPQNEYFNFAEGFAGTPWFELNDFCYRAYCHWDNWLYKAARPYVGHNPEYFADGFAAWVYMQTNGSPPIGPDRSDNWVRNGYEPNWQAISRGVEWSLAVTFNP